MGEHRWHMAACDLRRQVTRETSQEKSQKSRVTTEKAARTQVTKVRAPSAPAAMFPACCGRQERRGRGHAGRLCPRDSASPGTPARSWARPERASAPAPDG